MNADKFMKQLSHDLLTKETSCQYCGFSLKSDGKGNIKIWDNVIGKLVIDYDFVSIRDVDDTLRSYIRNKYY